MLRAQKLKLLGGLGCAVGLCRSDYGSESYDQRLYPKAQNSPKALYSNGLWAQKPYESFEPQG